MKLESTKYEKMWEDADKVYEPFDWGINNIDNNIDNIDYIDNINNEIEN